MKIALLFLACLVGISCHQQYIWPYPQLARYYPMVYANDHRYVIVDPEENSNKIISQDRDAQQIERRSRPQSRFNLFGNFPLLPLFPTSSSTAPFTFLSTTTFTTITSTVTTVSILTCLPSTAFVNALALTSTCLRKKREAAVAIENFEDEPETRLPISASAIQSIETSAIPTFDAGRSYDDEQPQLISSQNEAHQPVYRFNLPTYRQNFNLLPVSSSSSAVTYMLTYTSTVTTYSFTNTLVKRTLNIVAPPPIGSGGPLTCLPQGFAIC